MPIYRFNNKTPHVPPSAFIAPGATLIGDVTLAKNTSVWFNCVLRGDCNAIIVGENSNIQDLTMCHTDYDVPLVIGKRVTIGHNCVIHGCRIEDDCLIGMGAMVMNHAVIGRGSIVAAGAVVLEKTQIPPFSLVTGLPGKIKSQMEESMLERLQLPAKDYARRAVDYSGAKFEKIKFTR